ncbi:hypothetical protein LT706_17995 [Pseudomonas syringae pv. syringae]|uniref:hypothetical protein n=1 Tax=Pseudomonas syringae TaxID=317 RepID=UPI0006B9EE71|nr:hypothetical protein [Pseudomonas syringae]MCK9713405.1 hypothetical protein [Pseudomonas syringae pv. syringae]MCK9717661.1 hypothetical protein [Pseudomonas syringae pv. syringae]MCK9763081.1 hypothetical protein [Pseudomonas syringae pv. syringae]
MADTIEKSTLVWFAGILFGAVTTTATVTHVLHEQFITPLKVFESNQKAEKLNSQLESQKAALLDLNSTKEELDRARQKLAAIEHSNLFTKGEIYPATLNSVKLGQSIDILQSVYKKDSISNSTRNPDQPQLTVSLENSVFREVRYSYDPKTKTIVMVSYSLDYSQSLGKDFLKSALTRALGEPETSGTSGQYKWKVVGAGSGYLVIDSIYLVLPKGLAPRVWDGDSD